jgi:hypothetical protein
LITDPHYYDSSWHTAQPEVLLIGELSSRPTVRRYCVEGKLSRAYISRDSKHHTSTISISLSTMVDSGDSKGYSTRNKIALGSRIVSRLPAAIAGILMLWTIYL